ncbi:putative DNA replication complex GINS protein psf-3 [Podospora aff. communis PSN243]|uniref:DNA replication complex GINS protein PSF3 n=1 Tax=Podospora aff. communis PSN243 TaxID=3040156 RepID=A0AAV9GJD9_9PEZI|nr:putative DNA replication complex GINS protein psf-3 [Podospora aff. communis PSN243]
MSYYDIDLILTDAEKIPCTFQLDVPELGYLDNNPGQTLKAGARVALPLWLAELLAITSAGGSDDQTYVTFDLPSALRNDVVQALKAEPLAVPLRDQSAHFYSLATHMMDLSEEPELSATLRKTFVKRAAEIALHARKLGGAGKGEEGSNLGVGGAGEEFLRGLDEWERRLFRKAHDGSKAGKEWMEKIKKH